MTEARKVSIDKAVDAACRAAIESATSRIPVSKPRLSKRRPTVACAVCGRVKRPTANSEFPPHHKPHRPSEPCPNRGPGSRFVEKVPD